MKKIDVLMERGKEWLRIDEVKLIEVSVLLTLLPFLRRGRVEEGKEGYVVAAYFDRRMIEFGWRKLVPAGPLVKGLRVEIHALRVFPFRDVLVRAAEDTWSLIEQRYRDVFCTTATEG